MDFCGFMAHNFLNNQGGHARFVKKSGGSIAEAVEGKGVFVPGFVLGGPIFFLIPFSGKAGVSFNEARSEEDFSEFI